MDAWWGDGAAAPVVDGHCRRDVPRRIGRHQRGAGPGADGGGSQPGRCSAPARPTTSAACCSAAAPRPAPSKARRRLARVRRAVPPATGEARRLTDRHQRLDGRGCRPRGHGEGHGGQALAATGQAEKVLPALTARLIDPSRVVRTRAAEGLLALGIVDLPGAAGQALARAQDEYLERPAPSLTWLRTTPPLAGSRPRAAA